MSNTWKNDKEDEMIDKLMMDRIKRQWKNKIDRNQNYNAIQLDNRFTGPIYKWKKENETKCSHTKLTLHAEQWNRHTTKTKINKLLIKTNIFEW